MGETLRKLLPGFIKMFYLAVRCVTLRYPRYGRIISHSSYCGSKPTQFICNAGYQLVGSRRITCQSNGKWSAAIPTCVGKF
jgi:hypothetical protein